LDKNRGTDLEKLLMPGVRQQAASAHEILKPFRGFVMRQAASRNFPFWE
jgi:hypothetical protein